MRFSFKKTFGGDANVPEPKKPAKKRGYNPPGARTKNEPPRVPFREPDLPRYRVDLPGLNYRKPTDVPLEDSIDLRRRVAEAELVVTNAQNALTAAIEAFKAIGPLPDSILQSLSIGMRRQLSLYKQTKLQAPEVPWTVIKRVKSASRPGVYHEVRQDKLGQLSCTCEGYKYNNRCWVLDDVRTARLARRGEDAPEKE